MADVIRIGDHTVTEVTQGNPFAMSRTLQAQCSCGWRGTPFGAHHNTLHAAVREQTLNHLARAAREDGREVTLNYLRRKS